MERLEELQDMVDADAAKAAIEAGEEIFPAELVERGKQSQGMARISRPDGGPAGWTGRGNSGGDLADRER